MKKKLSKFEKKAKSFGDGLFNIGGSFVDLGIKVVEKSERLIDKGIEKARK